MHFLLLHHYGSPQPPRALAASVTLAGGLSGTHRSHYLFLFLLPLSRLKNKTKVCCSLARFSLIGRIGYPHLSEVGKAEKDPDTHPENSPRSAFSLDLEGFGLLLPARTVLVGWMAE